MAHRVIQWGTGNVGFHSLRHILRHPDVERVGVHAHDPDKAGKNGVSTSMIFLIYPKHADAAMREPLETACRTGETTLDLAYTPTRNFLPPL